MPGKSKEDNRLTQKEEIALKKEQFLEYYEDLPIKQAAADHIRRTLKTVNEWENKDEEFRDAVLEAKAKYARKHGKTRPDNLLPKLYEDFGEVTRPVDLIVHNVKDTNALQSALTSLGFVRGAGSGDPGKE